ncbi:DUF2079 domain-containing protein [Spirulina subsalsa]|uniref:DUF2079 domain-containing protein n=1 Tax=Spirulina subsalsa TaxID=54311 RepID=UPI0003129318|nr:DUF2079 domain-containing protein [Spirulina subsalsa]
MKDKPTQQPILWGLMGGSFFLFFACSVIRHLLFQSNAYDLGWFDQLVYLLSVGLPPVVSFAGDYHLLGDHVALILYPLALFYKVYPSVYWLFGVQALALAGSGGLVWQLARQEGLSKGDSLLMVGVYYLYPLVFNVNLYDFHPEVLAFPALLGAIGIVRSRRPPRWPDILGFICCLLVILSCKAVLSLTVAALGFWALCVEKRPLYGILAVSGGIAWFLATTQWIIPQFSGMEAAAVGRYSYLGDSVLEIALNVFLKPHLVWGHLLSFSSLEYFLLLFVPVFWGIRWPNLSPLVATLPTLGINLLSDNFNQRNLVQQYSVPLLPFLLLTLIFALAHHQLWVKNRKFILVWSVVGFLCLAKYSYFGSVYLRKIDTWQANRQAIALIPPQASVIAPSGILPHLTHRPLVQLPRGELTPQEMDQFDAILLDQRHPDFGSSPEAIARLREYCQNAPHLSLTFSQDEVLLFQRLGDKTGI